MGTSNFARCNTSKYYVVLENYENEEGEMVSPKAFEYETLKNNLNESLSQLPEYKKGGEDDRDRNYYGTAVCRLQSSKIFGDVEISVELTVLIVSGYYEAATLDFKKAILMNGYENGEDCDMYYSSNMNNGMIKIQGKNAQKWVKKESERLRIELEKTFEQFSSTYNRIGGFSDGTSIYEKAS